MLHGPLLIRESYTDSSKIKCVGRILDYHIVSIFFTQSTRDCLQLLEEKIDPGITEI